jgi:glycosyltransferase involved in cell wall biosynthesis
MKELRPDVVHAHSSQAGLYVRLCAGSLRRAVVYTPHCFAFERTDVWPLTRALFWLAEAVLSLRGGCIAACCTREVELAERLPGKMSIVNVPSTVRIPDALSTRNVLRGHNALRVMTLGRVAPQKGPEFFARAARASRAIWPDTRWIWIGGGEPALERALREAGVQVTGWMRRSDGLRLLATADAYVHTAAWEAAPLTILEAASLGIPILARAIPATRSFGLEALYETPESLARAVHQVESEQARERLRHQSARLLECHDVRHQRQALQNVYRRAAGRSPARIGASQAR